MVRGGAVLGGCLLAVLLAEGVLRTYLAMRGWTANCYAGHLQAMRPHPVIGAEPQPGFRLRSGALHVQFNSHGLRGPELSARNERRYRIALLGGSAAFGYAVSDAEEKCRLLEARFREESTAAGGGPVVEVINGGVSGYNLFQTIVRYREVIAPLEPDIVVLYLGWNDLTYLVSEDPGAERFRKRGLAHSWQRLMSHSTLFCLVSPHLSLPSLQLVPSTSESRVPTQAGQEQFVNNLRQLGDEIARSGARMVVCSVVHAVHPEVSDELLVELSIDPSQRAALTTLTALLWETLKAFAEDRGAEFIDAFHEISPSRTVLSDAVHLTAAGERQLADLLFERLKPMVPSGATAE
jgi:lysophospholipase L1-like esterase